MEGGWREDGGRMEGVPVNNMDHVGSLPNHQLAITDGCRVVYYHLIVVRKGEEGGREGEKEGSRGREERKVGEGGEGRRNKEKGGGNHTSYNTIKTKKVEAMNTFTRKVSQLACAKKSVLSDIAFTTLWSNALGTCLAKKFKGKKEIKII
jgi:hypothetical protein